MRPWYQNFWRLITHPYAFFEEAINRGNHLAATMTVVITVIFTGLGWMVIIQKWTKPSVYALNFILPLVTYPLAVFILFAVCRFLVRETRLRSFFAVWGYSYLPTFIFFIANILLHYILNFSWVQNLPGKPFLLMVFWAFIFLIFLWKVLFLAITLRLAGNLNLSLISIALPLLLLIAGIYWWTLASLGWIKIPFI